MTGRVIAGLDLGTVVTKVATASRAGTPTVTCLPSAATPGQDFIGASLREATAGLAGPIGHLACAVPDNWLDGDVEGARAFEELRCVVEDRLRIGATSYVGQAVAATVTAISRVPASLSGTCLVADLGATGVRTASCEVAGGQIRLRARHEEPLGDRDVRFGDQALRAAGAEGDGGLGDWLTFIQGQPRLTVVLQRALDDPDYRATPACSFTGANGDYSLTGGQLIDCFAETASRLRDGLSAVVDGNRPAIAALTGGLAWHPLASRIMADLTSAEPVVLEPGSAAIGALQIARGEFQLAPVNLPAVTLPVQQIRDGLLEEDKLALPWGAAFAELGSEPTVFDRGEVELEILGQLRTISIPGLRPGSYRVGVRPGTAQRGLLVLRGADASTGAAVHISVLDLEKGT